ncbi:cytochrome c biogenesis protein CcsA [Mucilaginibacter phyllosphaerae]|uniref:Cytochrome C biogenesis protein n=1 Tax=Mucilaginibacter phyllosphaerae TaxID=1812349 RepID=A0A4Y8AHU1_9SPHI|nr:cytochrome c biogenesis protein CcsA [Mucilaginibacter phyllosphaerae]MBB3968357.1 cytochrome c-type biogenesis protein CcmF [Mucilaginibacter phyllosphaerae]TEW68644.1 cytochrome C biogenesis protein [Mucilaginibacter phyllosphaerae]GGG99500.1 cytochrome c assembly protein [Mucilaginibacter phyllosphaerae]
MDKVFKGEHLLPGDLGQFFVVLAFGSALFSFICYFFATQETAPKSDNSWLKLGRLGYRLNTVAIIGMGVCLFNILYNHYFEYHYAWSYTSRELPVYYLISGFWNGQEGGFLLWIFWTAVLGNILIWKAKTWEKPVMTVMALTQVVLGTMLLGLQIGSMHIGSSPFLLLRNAIEGPIFQNPNYLDFIKDGKGMNPSLQNYWMIIHPPVLFLGTASLVVPFAYAVAGLWQRRYKEWVSAAIPYALFGCMILGTGVVMGSFWAYESLNFGGFWAWDPVENASIFPWLILVAAVHVLIVFKNTGHSYFTATFLTLIAFVLVWYSSFLARSGVLGESSVHAFTDLGLFWQLVIGVMIFLAITIYLLVSRWKELPITKKDEETYSREFWMFVGSVFLGLSCFHLIIVTSVPVWNLMFGTKLAPPTDPVKHYNVIQASFAVVIALLSGFTQFLKYKKTDTARFFITTLIYLVFAALITGLIVYATGFYKLHFVFIIVMLCSIYTIVGNGKILADSLKGKYKLAGSAVAHIGFGLLLVGALLSAGTQKVISENLTGEQYSTEFAKEENPKENILLYRNEPVKMGGYMVTFKGNTVEGAQHLFNIDYQRVKDGKVTETFRLRPNVIQSQGGMSSSPDTRHYLFHDLYTHITMTNVISTAPQEQEASHAEAEDKEYDAPVAHEIAIGDTMTYREGIIVLKGLNKNATLHNIPLTDKDIAVGAQLEVISHGKTYQTEPVYMIKGRAVFDFGKKLEEPGLKLRFTKIIPGKTPADGKVEIMVYQQPESKKKFIVMKAIEFPYINFLWAGTIIMILGFFMSILRRNKEVEVATAKVKIQQKR